MVPRVADGEVALDQTRCAAMLGVDASDGAARSRRRWATDTTRPAAFVEGLEVFIEPDSASVKTDHFLRPCD